MDNCPESAQNIVVMSQYQPDTGYAAIAQVEAYWEALRGERLLPKRSDIDPRGIEQALENAFILERIAPGIARLRIAGSHLNDVMGMEVRGMPLTSFFVPTARTEIADLLEVVFQTPSVSTLHLFSAATADCPELEGRLILLPLKSDLGDVSRVLGCLVAKGDIGLAPRRFEIARKEVMQITAGLPCLPALPKPSDHSQPGLPAPQLQRHAGMAESQQAFDHTGAGGRKPGKARPPYLRLVKSDK